MERTRWIGRRWIPAALSVALLMMAWTVPAEAATGAALSTPADLSAAGTFLDTFSGVANTDPLYGLNVGLDARQTGTAKASYTRVSGLWNSSVPPRPWAAQVNHPAHPNRLSFLSGTAAVMLDAPVLAGPDNSYTVATTIDPVLGSSTAADWGSLVFSRSRASDGYPSNSDVDLGFLIGASGGIQLFHAGAMFWSGSVPAADSYNVSLTVSVAADRTVTMVINGTRLVVVAPDTVGR